MTENKDRGVEKVTEPKVGESKLALFWGICSVLCSFGCLYTIVTTYVAVKTSVDGVGVLLGIVGVIVFIMLGMACLFFIRLEESEMRKRKGE